MEMRSYDIVIPGAAIAGAAAARVIEEHNRTLPDEEKLTYIILEGADHTGGRVQTRSFPHPDNPNRTITINTGAQWEHRDIRKGAAENPQVEMSEEYGLHTLRDTMPREFWDAGTKLNFAHNMELISKARELILAYEGPDMSLAEFFEKLNMGDALALKTTFGEVETGAPLDKVSLHDVKQLVACNMGTFLREGVGGFFEHFVEPVADHIETGSPVRGIHADTGEVTLASGEVIRSRRVIPTMSAGVLNSGDITFEGMPQSHTEALTHIEMGNFNKMFVVFDEDFKIPYNHNTHLDIHTKDGHDLFVLMRDNAQPLATVFVGGDMARMFDNNPEEARAIVIRGISEVLGEDITPHLAMEPIVTQWGKDPFVRGGYSRVEIGHADVREILAEPFGRVHLAGEGYGAVNPETGQNYATHMVGAMFSGERAAREAIQAIEQERRQQQENTLTIAGSTSASLRLK